MQKGERVVIDKYIYLDILFPEEELIYENILNNNSIVTKLNYGNFSCLFTGDIEKIAEERLIQLYSNTSLLNSTVLKVAHHGSKTSSIEEFLKLVQPKFALIGVGENNKFGHPNDEVMRRLEELRK